MCFLGVLCGLLMNIWDILRKRKGVGPYGRMSSLVCAWVLLGVTRRNSLPETKPNSLKKYDKSFFSGSLIWL